MLFPKASSVLLAGVGKTRTARISSKPEGNRNTGNAERQTVGLPHIRFSYEGRITDEIDKCFYLVLVQVVCVQTPWWIFLISAPFLFLLPAFGHGRLDQPGSI